MGFFSGITKPFKRIAKKVKNFGGKVMGSLMKLPGFKQLGQLYAKTFGKLGPLGTIAAGFLLPGIGSLIAQGWSAVAGSLAGSSSAFLQAVGSGMQSIATGLSTASGVISKSFSAVTDNISGAFSKMGGGNLTQGTQNLFQKASDWVTGGKSPSEFNLQAGSFLDPVTGPAPEFNLGTAITEPGSLLGKAVQEGSFADPSSISLGLDTSGLAQPTPAFTLPEVTPGTVARTDISGTGAVSVSSNAEIAASKGKGESFAKKALKAGATLLGGDIMAPPTEFATQLPGINDDFGTQRFGIGGTGATGGQFLTPQQQLFFQQHAKLIGQVG